MLFVDPTRGFLDDTACKERIAAGAPYAKWAADGFYQVGAGEAALRVPDDLVARQAMHGLTREELAMVLKPMANDAHEPTFSMGDDSPLPNLAPRARPVSHYLRQRFAQVTNPPIDPLRERLVMSLRTVLGPRQPLLTESAEAAELLTLDSFFLYPSGVDALELTDKAPWPVIPLDATFPATDGPAGLRAAVDRLVDEATAAVEGGAGILVLEGSSAGPDRAPVPSLLATGAVHQALAERKLRSRTALVVVADDVFDVHGFATLLGYGADAVCPALALATVAGEADTADDGDLTSPEAQGRYQAAVEAGVLKILSKMGICTVDSYRGAQIFEVVGLAPEVVDVCFTGSPNVVGGIGWEALGEDVLGRHLAAWGGDAVSLESPGFYRVRKGGEPHSKDKDTTQALNDLTLVQEAADNGQDRDMLVAHLLQSAIRSESSERYDAFAKLANDRALDRAARPDRAGPRGRPRADRRGRAGRRHRPTVLDRGHVARRPVEGGARDPGPGDEPARRPVELRRGRRGPRPLPHPGPGPRRQELEDQADRVGSLRRHARVPGPRRRAADQDGPGLQARRGRPAPRPQGVGRDRPPAPHPAGRRPDLAAARTTTSTPSRTWPSSSTTSSRSTRPRCR